MSRAATGLIHEAGFYDDDDGLLEMVVPFVEAALDAGEPTLVAMSPVHADLVGDAFAGVRDVTLLADNYVRPAAAAAGLRRAFQEHVRTSAGRMRLIGEIAVESPSTWGPWAHYEAACNEMFMPFPVTALCVYHSAIGSSDVGADVMSTHPWCATPDGDQVINDRYKHPEAFARGRPMVPDPLQRTTPAAELWNPEAAAARRAVRDVSAGSAVAQGDVDDLEVGVNEVVTNALVYGRPPVIVRMWASDEKVVVTVADSGAGLASPSTGLVPQTGGANGRGLWITHQICGQVDRAVSDDGFTVRLMAGVDRP